MALTSPENRRTDEPAEILPRVARCLNCGAEIGGRYCAACGQEAENQTVAVKLLVADFLADVASFDSKILRTLRPLLLRPGFLTNEYNAGRRVRYLSPLKVYLTLSVAFFLVLAWKHPVSTLQKHVHFATPGAAAAGAGVGHVLINGKSYDLAHLTLASYDAQQKAAGNSSPDGPLQRLLVRQTIKARAHPSAPIQQFVDSLPKMMFFLLPLFALSLKLVYWRSRRLYIEHLVFLLHAHAFLFLFMTAQLLLAGSAGLLLLPHQPLLTLASFALPLYLLVALKTVYRQSWPKTLLKSVFLAGNYLFLLLFCFLGALLIALMLA